MANTPTQNKPKSLDEAEGLTTTPPALDAEALAQAPDPPEDDRLARLEAMVLEQQAELARLHATNTAHEATLTPLADPDPTEPLPRRLPEDGGVFAREDVFRPWRVRARVGTYTGNTEGFDFANGQCTIAPLPERASENRILVRVLRLNNLRNYDVFPREPDPRQGGRLVTRRYLGYEVLTPEQYDEKYGQLEDGLDEIPEAF